MTTRRKQLVQGLMNLNWERQSETPFCTRLRYRSVESPTVVLSAYITDEKFSIRRSNSSTALEEYPFVVYVEQEISVPEILQQIADYMQRQTMTRSIFDVVESYLCENGFEKKGIMWSHAAYHGYGIFGNTECLYATKYSTPKRDLFHIYDLDYWGSPQKAVDRLIMAIREDCGVGAIGHGVKMPMQGTYVHSEAALKRMGSATKHDSKKPRTDLLDVDFLLGLAAVLTDGATKYGDNNWRQGMAYSRAYAALLRHLFAFWNGYDLDHESGLPHLDHAAAELMFLRSYATHEAYKANDDRPLTAIHKKIAETQKRVSGDDR